MDSLDILWEDPYGLAVNKPAGLLTQPAQARSVEPSLEGSIRAYLCPESPLSVYLGTVHRLDRPVSGVILWAKTTKAARRWAEQFAERLARKTYWAIVETSALADNLASAAQAEVWTDWLTAPDRVGQARVVATGTPGSVEAITAIEWGPVVNAVDGHPPCRWLRLHPRTGRTHQLRAQTTARGCPIVGDAAYGSQVAFDQGIALHARALRINHPIRHEPMTIEAELPPAWNSWTVGSPGLIQRLSQTRFPESAV